MLKAAIENTARGRTLTDQECRRVKYFFLLYYQDLCRYANKYTRDFDISRDIVQSTFVRLLEMHFFEKEIANVKSYLYKSVKNELLNYLKHRKVIQNSRKQITTYTDNLQEDREIDLDRKRKLELISRGINQLPEQCRVVFKLSRENGLTYKEIAQFLGISVKTVETQMERAFKSLREWVKRQT